MWRFDQRARKRLKYQASLEQFSVDSLIAQPVERRTVNPQVPGSNPGRGAKQIKGLQRCKPLSFEGLMLVSRLENFRQLCTLLCKLVSGTSFESPQAREVGRNLKGHA